MSSDLVTNWTELCTTDPATLNPLLLAYLRKLGNTYIDYKGASEEEKALVVAVDKSGLSNLLTVCDEVLSMGRKTELALR
jgi:hypothetical protein